QDVFGQNLLGTTSTLDGSYRIEYSEEQFRRTDKEVGGPELFVLAYNQDDQVVARSKVLRNAGREVVINLTIDDGPRFFVRGQVFLKNGRPVVGARITAYDKDMRTKEQLGEHVYTDKDG